MTNILKPFGRGKVLTEEEVVAQLEGYVPPVVETPVVQPVVVVPSTDIVMPEDLGDIVDFHGKDLVRKEYDALTSIAQTYFQKTAEEYFSNIDHVISENVYLNIINQHVSYLTVREQLFSEIPVGLGELTQLQTLSLHGNNISKIENLDGLAKLKILYLSGNNIDYDVLHNKQELQKLEDRGVAISR